MMLALSMIIALFGVSTVNGGRAFSDWGAACLKVTQCYPLNSRGTICSAYKSVDKSVTRITGYFKNMGGYYKKVNDINCVKIEDMIPMYMFQSGSKYYLDPTKKKSVSSAEYSNCYTTSETFPKAVCDAPGNGPEPNRPMILSISTQSASKCATMWATTEYSNANGVVFDIPSDWVSPVSDWDLDKVFVDGDEFDPETFDGNMPDEDFPNDDINNFGIEQPDYDFEEQPKLSAPVIDAPVVDAPNADPQTFTVSVGKWSLLILTLVMANIAVIMTILYCREKNKNADQLVTDYKM